MPEKARSHATPGPTNKHSSAIAANGVFIRSLPGLELAAAAHRDAGGRAFEHDRADCPDGQTSYDGRGDSSAGHDHAANDLKNRKFLDDARPRGRREHDAGVAIR